MGYVASLHGAGRRRHVLFFLLCGSVLLGTRPAPPARNGFHQVEVFGSNPGNLNMYLYVPGLRPVGPRPLVVALHGCYGSAQQFRSTGWESAGWHGKFYVLFPEQRSENHEIACFNHYADNEPEKGEGEIQSLLQMIAHVRRHYPVDSKRVFLTGFSSGGQMALVLAARFPDVFQAAAVVGSGGFRCTPGHAGIAGFARCVNGNVVPASRRSSKRRPRLSLWHGLQDRNVPPSSVVEAVAQWTHFVGVDRRADRIKKIAPNIVRTWYTDRRRQVQVETVLFQRMAHSVPVRPPHCGSEVDRYFSKERLCFAWESARFFGLVR